MVLEEGLQARYDELRRILAEMGAVAVAYSGGVDSTLLVQVAHDVLGDHMLAVTSAGHVVPASDVARTREFCAERRIRHLVVDFDEFAVPGFAENPPDRCYHCKKALFTALARSAGEQGIDLLVDGSNVDDLGDYRPGLRALEELGIRSPLREAGLTKADIRTLSHELGLPTWEMPSAACLASRFAYGDAITAELLARVGGAEELLRSLGLGNLRVRVHGAHGELARIEVDAAQIVRMAEEGVRTQVVAALRELGFVYVALDLVGFRSGAMNEVL